MKFTLSWLKDHLDTHASLDVIGKTLTAIGLEVEGIEDRGKDLQAFTVAKILHAEKHPEADKLRVCRVQSDAGELQIVCGAPNARAGLYVVLAKEGALIPANGMVIKKTNIRGVESNGMLCSAEELGLPGDSSGIIELPEAPIGESIVTAMGLNDPVIEIAITPNRADCLGVRGVARDLAAAGLGTLRPLPALRALAKEGTIASPVSISIASPHCAQFIGAYVKGVRNGPSPDWLKKRLEAIGQKSISALVDITNYLTFDLGRPLHVYDADTLRGDLHARPAQEGERIQALNGKEYALREGMCVIADDAHPIAIAGIVGGTDTGCTETTENVFLEVALFDPVHVAQNGRALEVLSDARYRFERGVDPAFVEEGARIALALIQELCGGEASEIVHAGKTPEWKRTLTLRAGRVASLGGVTLNNQRIESILSALGFEMSPLPAPPPQAGEGIKWNVIPPSWRGDVEGEADLVEEVLRIHGYDHIPVTLLPKLPVIAKPALNLAQKRIHLAKRTLAAQGLQEVCTWSFLPHAQAKRFGGGQDALVLLNPISSDLDTMRPSLLPNLLEAAKKNAFRGFRNLALFEVGLQFAGIAPDQQRMVAAGLLTGETAETEYANGLFKLTSRPADAFDAKAKAIAVLHTLGISKYDITTQAPDWYHPGRSGSLTLGGKIVLAHFGEIHPGTAAQFEVESRVAAFEIFLDALPVPRSSGKARTPLQSSDFQAVERDFAFIVDAGVTAQDMVNALAKADKKLVTDVQLFDVYTGAGVEPGKKSVAIKITLQAPDRTLSEQDIAAVSQAIIAAAQKGFGGQLRA